MTPILSPGKVALQNSKYLIVDDEISNVRLLEQMLGKWGCKRIKSTTNPREAVALFNDFNPDVMLLDLMMPEVNGFDIMAQLKPLIAENDYLPILVLTADTTIPTRHRALAEGAKDFLTKPFDMVELSLRLTHLVETRSLHRELGMQNQILDIKVQERTRELAQSELETIECLAVAAEYRDDDTGEHAQRVGNTAGLLAECLGLSEAQCQLIRSAAPLHDIGKIGIADDILLKPGKLTNEEFAIMEGHTTIGAQILKRHHTPSLQLASKIALSHHERWNGKGYPNKLEGDAIPLIGRIVTVADVFDALTHIRPYKKAWPIEEAITEIQRQSGEQFDPRIVEAFMTLPHESMI
jgi:putative two-component system response regulator